MSDQYPQDPHRTRPGRLKDMLDPNNGDPWYHTLEQIIERAEAGDENCREWLYGEAANIPRADLPKGFIRCSQCKCGKHRDSFSPDTRKRNGRQSQCKQCRAANDYRDRHERMMRRINAVTREVMRTVPNLM